MAEMVAGIRHQVYGHFRSDRSRRQRVARHGHVAVGRGVVRTSYSAAPTRLQQRLTASIASGLPITEAAKREGVRVSTARTQLQRIYDKVGVRAQPALVQALLTATLA